MRRRLAAAVLAAGLITTLLTTAPATAEPAATAATTARAGHYEGTLPDGATWVADVPARWNGTLVLFSHGFGALVAIDAPDPGGPARPARPRLRPRRHVLRPRRPDVGARERHP